MHVTAGDKYLAEKESNETLLFWDISIYPFSVVSIPCKSINFFSLRFHVHRRARDQILLILITRVPFSF